jgi:excisionase family DNA binding protein
MKQMHPINCQLPPITRLLRISTVADTLAVSRAQVYALIYRGQLPSVRIGRALRIPEEAVRRIAVEGLPSDGSSR